MTHTQIIMKLVGPIAPTGDANRDDERMQNLKALCMVVEDLISEVENVHNMNRGAMEHSVKEMAEFAKDFLTNDLGIQP